MRRRCGWHGYDRATLLITPLHVVIRDLPETLAVLRRNGVDVRLRGADPLAEVAGSGEEAENLLLALEDAIAWRLASGR